MKNKSISKILGWGLATGLIFASVAAIFAGPVAADEMKWSTINTPSWEDHVIEPGSDITDFAVGPDGDTIYAVGQVGGADDNNDELPGGSFLESSIGLTGSFDVASGWIKATKISDTLADFEAVLYGDACYLRGEFVLNLYWFQGPWGWGWLDATGEITHGDQDVMTFSGKLQGIDVAGYDGVQENITSGDTICVEEWWVQDFTMSTDSGSFNGGGDPAGYDRFLQPRVWKSTDGGVTWSNITSNVQAAANLPGPFHQFMYGGVAVAPDDEEWLVIGGGIRHPDEPYGRGGFGPWDFGVPAVVASKDGGDNFSYTGEMEDTSQSTRMNQIYDLAVAPETDDIHNVAVAGINNDSAGERGTVYRLKAGTWLTSSWIDTSYYTGWDNGVGSNTDGIVAVAFSPNIDIDDSILCMGVSDGVGAGNPYLQSGIWESNGTWNDEAGFPNAVEITADGDTLWTGGYLRSMGLALPSDYDGSDPGARAVFIYVNAYNDTTDLVGGFVCRVDNGSVSTPYGPRGEPLISSIAFYGEADTGKMMVAEYVQWDNDAMEPIPFDSCEGVRVWHTVELDPCCPAWEIACKNPSGPYLGLVTYTPDGDKAYATTSGSLDPEYFPPPIHIEWGHDFAPWTDPIFDSIWGGLGDESAFSVSRDDGVSFNQLGLIDTDIDYLSDMAV